MSNTVSNSSQTMPADGDLLKEYLQHHRQEAFVALVQRHGPMVLRVCRAHLADAAEAEDCSQAVFLTLARRAAELTKSTSIAGWLYRVAWYVATRAAKVAATRHRHEMEAARMKQQQTNLVADVPVEQLHAGLAALSEKYRVPLVLHYLEGFTQEQIAIMLGLRMSAVGVRLMRGRKRLHEQLGRKGLTVSMTALGLALAAQAAHPAAATAAAITKMAAAGVASTVGIGAVSAQAAALSQGVIRLLIFAKIQLAAWITGAVLAAVGMCTGLGMLIYTAASHLLADNAPTAIHSSNGPMLPTGALPTFDFLRMEDGKPLHATLTVLVSFDDLNTGAYPKGTDLIGDSQGNLYGTTSSGGPDGQGTAFMVAPATGAFTTLASFGRGNGSQPQCALLADAQGNLYGTTKLGGDLTLNFHGGVGTVFKITAGSNQLVTLAKFNGDNGACPDGGLTRDAAGNLYGITMFGGDMTLNDQKGGGTVFKIAAATNAITTLATFDRSSGICPQGGLIADRAGNLYGTTTGGAGLDSTVFEVAAGTGKLITLARFTATDGVNPNGRLAIDAAGNLFGTTYSNNDGTDVGGSGTVFEVVAGSNTITTLARFDGSNGEHPEAGVILDAAGNIYGTTRWRGPHGHGTVFKVVPRTKSVVTLMAFDGANGELPTGGLYADAAGNLYGTTKSGGDNNQGTVFELSGTGFVVGAK